MTTEQLKNLVGYVENSLESYVEKCKPTCDLACSSTCERVCDAIAYVEQRSFEHSSVQQKNTIFEKLVVDLLCLLIAAIVITTCLAAVFEIVKFIKAVVFDTLFFLIQLATLIFGCIAHLILIVVTLIIPAVVSRIVGEILYTSYLIYKVWQYRRR